MTKKICKNGKKRIILKWWQKILLILGCTALCVLAAWILCENILAPSYVDTVKATIEIDRDAMENMMETISIGDKKELVQCVKGVISVSSENKRKCIDYQLSDQENITVQPNCADTTIFYNQEVAEMKRELGIGERDFTIAFVGGFIPRKGPDRLARAVTNLNDKHIKVMFIGKPFSGYDYEFDCPGIIHKGSADHDVIPKLLNCADVFVLPTKKEGCCNAIIEATVTLFF